MQCFPVFLTFAPWRSVSWQETGWCLSLELDNFLLDLIDYFCLSWLILFTWNWLTVHDWNNDSKNATKGRASGRVASVEWTANVPVSLGRDAEGQQQSNISAYLQLVLYVLACWLKIFSGPKFCRELIFMFLIFVTGWTNKNILTPKISNLR